MNLLVTIERYLRRRAVAPSRFGREATGDPRFVFDMRRGREPRPHMAAKVLGFIAHSEAVCPGQAAITKSGAQGSAPVVTAPALAECRAWRTAVAASQEVA